MPVFASSEMSSGSATPHPRVRLPASPGIDSKIIGGGGHLVADSGNFLTENYPEVAENKYVPLQGPQVWVAVGSLPIDAWIVAGSDSVVSHPGELKASSINLQPIGGGGQIEVGVVRSRAPASMRNDMNHVEWDADVSHLPVDPSKGPWVMVGGGARIDATPGSAFLTASYPVPPLEASAGSTVWRARAKDHEVAFGYTLEVFAVAMRYATQQRQIRQRVISSGWKSGDHVASAEVVAPKGWVPCGGGAESQYHIVGKLLTSCHPVLLSERDARDHGHFKWFAAAHDHRVGCDSPVQTHLIAVDFI